MPPERKRTETLLSGILDSLCRIGPESCHEEFASICFCTKTDEMDWLQGAADARSFVLYLCVLIKYLCDVITQQCLY